MNPLQSRYGFLEESARSTNLLKLLLLTPFLPPDVALRVKKHLRQHTTPPFSFAKTDFTQSSLTSRENFCFDFQLNELQSFRS